MKSSSVTDGYAEKPEALGESEVFLDFLSQLSRVASVNRPVLILGERGTGKELVAARLHYLSTRWQGPLVTLNCAALAPTLLEAELFGHEMGAFTGAAKRRPGRFESAQNGTLFLDEIGLVSRQIQEKLLRVVEYNAFERVGSSDPVRVDVRIVSATNANLRALAARGEFKEDLLDRLSFEVLHLPPLRQRHGDIPLLARHFAARMAAELRRPEPPAFSASAISSLERHAWPGNIRELKNVVERAVYRCDGPCIDRIEFNPFRSQVAPGEPASREEKPESAQDRTAASVEAWQLGDLSLADAVRSLEVSALQSALARAKFHQGQAAALLGLTYHQFRALYRKHRSRLPG